MSVKETPQVFSLCDEFNKKKIKDREWICKSCGTKHDRDINAAINIKNFGLRNKPSVTQSSWLQHACDVETQKSLASV